MAIVTTDNKHYTNIADAIRADADVSTRYAPEEMAEGVHQVYAKGKSDGYTEGETAGKAAGRAEVEAENAEILTDINTALVEKGAESADSLTDVPEKIGSIKAGGGDSWYDVFWDNYQQNGERTDCEGLFNGVVWNPATLRPKYNMRPKKQPICLDIVRLQIWLNI